MNTITAPTEWRTAAEKADDRIIEKAFEQIAKEHPISPITRSDIRQWLDLLRPLIAERMVVATHDGARTWIGGDTVTDLLDTINSHLSDGYTPSQLVIEGLTQ